MSSHSLYSLGLSICEDEDNNEDTFIDLTVPSHLVRPSTLLTERIINHISKSIKVFRPSKSLGDLVCRQYHESGSITEFPDSPGPVAEIDVVISGGGMKCYYVCGCISILQQQLAHNNVKIARVAGASAGAWSALFIAAGIPTAIIIESYHQCAENPRKYLHDVYCDDLWPKALEAMPKNAYEICTGKLHISITVITSSGLKNVIINEFHSNDELLQACCASSTIPYITEKSWCRYFRGLPCLDGGLTNNTPIFPDQTRRQLVFRLSQIEYPWKHMITPIDSCIDALVIRGALQMSQFLSGEYVPAMSWLEKEQSRDDLYIPGQYVRRAVAPFAVGGVAVCRWTGIGELYDYFEQACALGNILASPTATVIDFKNAEVYFSESPFFYALGILYAAIVGVARKLYLLL